MSRKLRTTGMALGGVAALIGTLSLGTPSSASDEVPTTASAASGAAGLPAGATAHWDFRDGAGGTVTDVAGNHDGVLQGAQGGFWGRTDRHGDTVGQFNGTDNHVVVDSLDFPAGDFWGLAAVWVEDFRNYDRILSFFSADRGFRLQARTGIEPGFVFAASNGSTSSANLDYRHWGKQWLVVQVGHRASDNMNFVSVNEATSTFTKALSAPDAEFVIGGDNGNQNGFAGRIADVVWYDGKYPTDQERADAVESLLTRVHGEVNITVDDGAVPKSTIVLPSDGNSSGSGRDHYSSQLWSTEDKVFVTDHQSFVSTSTQARAWRYSKSGGEMASTIDPGQEVSAYSARGKDFSHLGVAVGVDGTGKVHFAEHRYENWRTKVSTSPMDVTGLALDHNPTSGGNNLTYSFMTLDDDGELHLRIQDRAEGKDGIYWWKYNSSTGQWEDSFASNPILRNSPGTAGKVYAPWALFDDDIVWAVGSQNVTYNSDRKTGPFVKHMLIRSADGGSTWARPSDGASVALPGTPETTDIVAPTSRANIREADKGGLAVTLDDHGGFHGVSSWTNHLRGDTKGSLWYYRWDETGEYYTHQRLLEHGAGGVGSARIGAIGERLFIIAPADSRNTSAPVGTVYLFVSEDYGDSWTRFTLDAGGADYVSEGSLDFQGLVVDGKIRFMPLFDNARERAEVWEFELPPSTALVVDNAEAEFSGTWQSSAHSDGFYGSDYVYRASGGVGSNWIKWRAAIPEAGDYAVYYWIPDGVGSQRATDAKLTVWHGGQSTEYSVNQRGSGGRWQLLGVHAMTTAQTGNGVVQLSDEGNGTWVVGDAVMFVPQ